ncbi:MAG: phosphoadenylyl-sulfate reductase [Burkholderiales bacterium]|jgi:phosphoadenosine phosphosulfate reductase|nr:phosphoadenylyl-sulfate reductase [Burkholderiales bacterium]
MSAVAVAPAARATPAAVREAALHAQLAEIAVAFPDAALASSLGAEDMVLTDAILRARLPLAIFTLDTGRLHAETLALVDAVQQRYGATIVRVQPDAAAVDAHVAAHGAFAFYDSVALRKACCAIRKVEPLARALAGRRAWITGLRRAQSAARADVPAREVEASGRVKFNPLADWSEADVWHYLDAHAVPRNALHARGYPSIGCEPCTRAIKPGEDIRAGRWWWESDTAAKKECGLHVAPTA